MEPQKQRASRPPTAENQPLWDSTETIQTDIQNGTLVPFGFCIGARTAGFTVVSSDTRTVDGETRSQVVYREREAPLMVTLSLSAVAGGALLRMSLRLHAERGISDCIHSIETACIPVPAAPEDAVVLAGITGGYWDTNNVFPPPTLQYYEKPVEGADGITLESGPHGRSADKYVPLWLLSGGRSGLWFGPEWSGCWGLTVRRADDGAPCLRFGLPTFSFVMLQGETVELPVFAMGGYRGSLQDGGNRLRQVIAHHYLPRLNGAQPTPPVVSQGLGGLESFQTEENLYREAERAAEIGCEVFTLDAGWYHSPTHRNWFKHIGDWVPHPERFPRGMKALTDTVHARGMKFGLWIESRIAPRTEAHAACSHFLLKPLAGTEKEENLHPVLNADLLDLGKREGQEWLEDLIERLINVYGADIVWYDFNTDPRAIYWDYYEEDNRKGLMELAFYQGLYRVFDRVIARHPDIWIQSCASGGRCIDLGMLRRSHSIWVNDFSGLEAEGQPNDQDINRNFRSSLNRFLPAVVIQNALFIPDRLKQDPAPYGVEHFLTHFGGVLQFLQGLCRWKEADLATAKRCVALYKQLRAYLEKDFYPLYELPRDKTRWDGWQYHDAAGDAGIMLLFKLEENTGETTSVTPMAMDDLTAYCFETVEGDAVVEARGTALHITMPNTRAALLTYRRDKPEA